MYKNGKRMKKKTKWIEKTLELKTNGALTNPYKYAQFGMEAIPPADRETEKKEKLRPKEKITNNKL